MFDIYTLRSDHLDKFSTHLSRFKVTVILLTVFPNNHFLNGVQKEAPFLGRLVLDQIYLVQTKTNIAS